MQAFDVYKKTKLIDTVFYSEGCKVDKEEVRKSLITHDGYDFDIIVRKSRGIKQKYSKEKPNSFSSF